MKKNITINLCGRLFQIDEDAYELLQQYIDSLRHSFGRQEGGEEIADDIEARIAELFDELRQKGIEAITIDHVKEIITRIGRPEELAGEDEKQNDKNGGHRYDSFRTAAQDICDNVRARTAGKKLYRNPKDKMLAGVLSGIAAYTNTDPVVWRLLTVLLVLVYGVGILAYIVLAIVVPEARTPEQLLQMEGKEVTPQNLADVVIDDKQPAQSNRSCLGSVFSVALKLLAGLLLVFAAIIGLVLLGCFLLAAGALIIVFTVPGASHHSLPFDIGYLHLPEVYAAHPWLVIIFIVSLLLALILPVYAIIHILLEKAGKLQPMSIPQRIICIAVWIVALFSIFPSLIALKDLRNDEYQANVPTSRAPWLNYSINDVPMVADDFNYFSENHWIVVKHQNDEDSYAPFTSYSEYYTGDMEVRYFEHHSWDDGRPFIYQAESQDVWVEPGVYSLSCMVRADGRGTFVYTLCNGEKQLAEIPPYGRKGGELWLSIDNAKEVNGKYTQELKAEPQWKKEEMRKIAAANHSRGFGWSEVKIDNIVVTADSIPIVYGVSTVPEFTGQPCHAKMISATDFVLTRTSDLPKQ